MPANTFPAQDTVLHLLRRAIELSRETMEADRGGPFGAVVARGDEILGEGANRVTSSNDPTAHAEIVAIRHACRNVERFDLRGCVIYTSCEPCPMCLGAIYWARLDGIVYANTREDAADIGFDDAHFYDHLAQPLEEQPLPSRRLLASEARRVFAAWRDKPDRIDY